MQKHGESVKKQKSAILLENLDFNVLIGYAQESEESKVSSAVFFCDGFFKMINGGDSIWLKKQLSIITTR